MAGTTVHQVAVAGGNIAVGPVIAWLIRFNQTWVGAFVRSNDAKTAFMLLLPGGSN